MFFLNELPSRDMIAGYVSQAKSGDVSQIETALTRMREASLLVRLIDKYFSDTGLSQLKFLILVVIDREPNASSLRASEINQKLDVSKPVLHRTIQSLLAAGLLKQIDDPEDRRAYRLTLTREGSSKLLAVLPGYFHTISQFMENANAQRI